MVKIFKSAEGKRMLLQSYDKLLLSWGVPFEEQTIKTHFGHTHVITSGNKTNPPLVLFHGTGDNSAIIWVNNLSELAQHFFVVAVDTLGGPGKSEPNENYSKNFDSVRWIDEILEALKLRQVHMAGVSYGVTLILHYAFHRPHKVLNMVCMAGAFPVGNWISKLSVMKTITIFFPEILFPSAKNAVRLLKKLSGPHFTPTDRNEPLIHFEYILRHTIPAKRKIIEFKEEQFHSFRGKILFLIGEYDPIANTSSMLRFLEHQTLQYKVISHGGHTMNSECAEVINKEIIGFLEKRTFLNIQAN